MFPGIPPLLNKISSLDRTIVMLTTDAARLISLFSSAKPQWGLYRNGKIALHCDSVTKLDFKADFNVLDYPVEKGAFESYNKVKTPRDVRLRMTKGGTNANRSQFLLELKTISESLDLFDVYMPEARYQNLNMTHFEFTRGATAGVGLLSVDAWFIEIMEVAAPTFTNTATASGNSPDNGGTVQPQTATTEQQNILLRGPRGDGQ